MKLTNSEKNGYTVIAFDGSLDTVSSPAAEKEINTLIDNGTLKFVFNFDKHKVYEFFRIENTFGYGEKT